jgi:hypothetical protein
MLRLLDLVGRILAHGNHVEIEKTKRGLILIVRPKDILSRNTGGVIREGGFRLQRCYNEPGGKTVMVFLNDRIEQNEY